MMRTVETVLVIAILVTALSTALFATWPALERSSSADLQRLALSTLGTLDADDTLSETVFKSTDDPAWADLQIALSSCLPPNVVYNLTVYRISNGSIADLYYPINSISNSENLGASTDAASYLVTQDLTFSREPEKINGTSGGTLYILNCSDASGWWITGYSAHTLASEMLGVLSPYFQQTVVVQNTIQLGQILNGTALQNETLPNAVICNVFGEVVPISQGYYMSTNVGYDSAHSSYARYCHTLGMKTRLYNWTWVSIVGWPLYYVSNSVSFSGTQNGYGIYGIRSIGSPGRTAFLQGLDNQPYYYSSEEGIGPSNVTTLTSEALDDCNYYGLYPNPNQTTSRSIPLSILPKYHLSISFQILGNYSNEGEDYVGGALFKNSVSGSFLALGLTRTPDVRLTALGLLGYYKPKLRQSEPTGESSSRLVILSLGRMGGA